MVSPKLTWAGLDRRKRPKRALKNKKARPEKSKRFFFSFGHAFRLRPLSEANILAVFLSFFAYAIGMAQIAMLR